MIELQEHTGKLKIENYGLWDFLQDFQQGVNQGYELDDSNEGFPQVFGSLYTCLLKPKEHTQVNQLVEGDKTPSDRIFEEVQYLRKELKDLQEKTVYDLALKVEVEEPLVIAPFASGGELPDEQKLVGEQASEQRVYPGGSPDTPEMTTKPVEEQEVNQQAKRGPKPKNK